LIPASSKYLKQFQMISKKSTINTSIDDTKKFYNEPIW